ncbi:hypothetical protein Q31b_44630 [Novipirellula aureliae]|uniref:Uncharacterized protein n=1 Tax=Novipirellula aureliae TaxID=2527966 RepID=A0A5C6DNC0_9BACT|nr:hypothetical protein [Novipirellula aureliae]TWU37675.1 hypothetical protein Q31b_44630 [Novipirellula aureliae]
MKPQSDHPPTFNTLGNYKWPSVPADESLKKFSWKIWRRYRRQRQDPFISDESLRSANRRKLDSIAVPPLCGTILEEMQATFADWIADPAPARWLHLVVLPPCEPNDLVRTWARQHGHRILEPPSRDVLTDPRAELTYHCDSDDAVLVVPRLERWFLRHYDGLHHVRNFLSKAAEAERHCVIGCNSWAWAFLNKAIGAGGLLPAGLTFAAFDADRLRVWFEQLATHADYKDRTFRFSTSGNEVFPSDLASKETGEFFQKLAATSLGIPWIAWHLWRRRLRFGPDDEQQNAPSEKFPDETTIWVAALEEMKLPSCDVDASLLTLHTLLIHDGLTASELDVATPSVDASNVLPSLMAAGFVRREGDQYFCAAAAYPAIRDALQDSGFPLDQL